MTDLDFKRPPLLSSYYLYSAKNRLYIGVISGGGVFTAQVERPHNPGHHHDQGTEGAHVCDQLTPPEEGHHDDSDWDNNSVGGGGRPIYSATMCDQRVSDRGWRRSSHTERSVIVGWWGEGKGVLAGHV